MLDQSNARFETTRWTLVHGLTSQDAAHRANAIDSLVRLYWPAVYAFLRRKGLAREDAAETTEAFFADVVLGRELLEGAEPEKGKLRTLVLTALQRFRIDLSRRAAARGTARRVPADSLAQEDAMVSGADSPERAFERRWALALVQDAAARCEHHYRQTGKQGHWSLFEARVLRPAAMMVEAPPLALAAAECGFVSAADAAAAVQVVKKRFTAILAEVSAKGGGDGWRDVARALE